MKLDRINYQKTFNLGNYTSERIGMEAQIDDGEDAQVKLKVLKDLVEDAHRKMNPQLDFGLTDAANVTWPTTPQPTSIPSIDRKTIERLEIMIDDCKEVKDLEDLKSRAYSYGLNSQYDERLKQLLAIE